MFVRGWTEEGGCFLEDLVIYISQVTRVVRKPCPKLSTPLSPFILVFEPREEVWEVFHPLECSYL